MRAIGGWYLGVVHERIHNTWNQFFMFFVFVYFLEDPKKAVCLGNGARNDDLASC